MKPTGVPTLFLASALELRTNAQGIICVYRGRECIGLGEVSEFFFVPPLLMGCCEVHTIRVGMAPPPQAESTQRDRVSGVRRRSRGRSCKTDARMLVASTLAGKICQSRAARGRKVTIAEWQQRQQTRDDADVYPRGRASARTGAARTRHAFVSAAALRGRTRARRIELYGMVCGCGLARCALTARAHR